MVGYVKRINDATLRVPIGGVRIGSAKYSRLAQINLRTHIITFSRYAIENVPERGRRYLVLHELAHVKEASHNKRFWQLVAEHEPRYKEIGKELEHAFHQNVRAEQRTEKNKNLIRQARLFPVSTFDEWDAFRESLDLLPEDSMTPYEPEPDGSEVDPGLLYPLDSGVIHPGNELFNCDEHALDSWSMLGEGIIYGGSDHSDELVEDYLDHI